MAYIFTEITRNDPFVALDEHDVIMIVGFVKDKSSMLKVLTKGGYAFMYVSDLDKFTK